MPTGAPTMREISSSGSFFQVVEDHHGAVIGGEAAQGVLHFCG